MSDTKTMTARDVHDVLSAGVKSGPSKPIQNRYEFTCLVAVKNANPNGDPDMANQPRVDPETLHGIMTDVSIKRRIRDYVSMAHGTEPGMNMSIVSETNLGRVIAEAKELAGVALTDKTVKAIEVTRAKICQAYWDGRTFGGVMAVGPNGGQIRGPVQIAFGESLDPVHPMNIGVTRVCSADAVENAATAQDYRDKEAATPADKLRTMGRKTYIPFGLYEIHGFVSANLAQQTGFDEQDLQYLFEALANMYDATRSASKGTMSVVSPVIIFKHVGDPSQVNNAPSHANECLLGCAPAHKLFELVQVAKKPGVEFPRSHWDYDAVINLSACPKGVEIGFLDSYSQEGIVWNKLPSTQTWMKSV